MKRLALILNGKGGVGKRYASLRYILNQPTKTAVGRLTLCKPFLATAAVWLDSVARCCRSHLGFCFRKTCPAGGTKQPSISVINHHEKSSGNEASLVDAAVDNESEKNILRNRPNQLTQPAQRAAPL